MRIDFRDVPLGATRTRLRKQVPLGQVFDYCVQVYELGQLSATLDEQRQRAGASTKATPARTAG